MDDPAGTKRGLAGAYQRLLELDFDLLLLAHGEPVTADARGAARAVRDRRARLSQAPVDSIAR